MAELGALSAVALLAVRVLGGRARRLARARRLLWRVLLLLAYMRSAVAREWRSTFGPLQQQ